jgi:transcription termination factor Rho
MDIAELKAKNIGELQDLAEELNISNFTSLRKQDLTTRIQEGLLDADVVLTAEGVLEILPEGYGFLRSQDWNYLYGPDDIYVSPSQIKRFGLRTGDSVAGEVRPPKDGERYLALLKVDSVNGLDPEAAKNRGEFEELRPCYPERRIVLEVEGEGSTMTMRVVDLIAPIGFGQRGLIVSPPKAGKTTILQEMANSIVINSPDVHLIVLLIDERPEEVTDMIAHVDAEVIASTFDEPAERHVQVAESSSCWTRSLASRERTTRPCRTRGASCPAGSTRTPCTSPRSSSVPRATSRMGGRSRSSRRPSSKPAAAWTRSSSRSSRAPGTWSWSWTATFPTAASSPPSI